MDALEKIRKKLLAGQHFRPGTPIDRFDLLAGRNKELNEIIGAINQTGQHIVIFGERGVGKTSLSRVLVEILAFAGSGSVDVIGPDNVNCDSTDNFSTIWAKVFQELQNIVKTRNRESSDRVTLIEMDGDFDLSTPGNVRFALGQLPKPAIIVLDEVDQLEDELTTALLAATIKDLSDHATRCTLILIGVAETIDDLIQEHASISRALVEVHLRRMSVSELRGIVDKAAPQIGVAFEARAINRIVNLSVGLPHYTHQLALRATESAIDCDRTNITTDDVESAIRRTIDSRGQLLTSYLRGTESSQSDAIFEQVLLACALARKSDLGTFRAAAVRGPLSTIMGKLYDIPAFSGHISKFCSEERGYVLVRGGQPRQYTYRFRNPYLQAFVILHGLSKELITPEMIDLDKYLDEPAYDGFGYMETEPA